MDIANIIEQVERYGALRRGGYEDDATKQLEDIKRESDWTPRR